MIFNIKSELERFFVTPSQERNGKQNEGKVKERKRETEERSS